MSDLPNAPASGTPTDAPKAPNAFIPLEANPPLMTTLLHKLGLSPTLACHDVFSLTEPELLAFVPRPALALLLVFPVSAAYESHRLAEDSLLPEYEGKGEGERVLWFRQTIRNACGMMGLLHASLNGASRDMILPSTPLSTLLTTATPLAPSPRSKLIEDTPALATAHAEAASQGDTAAPEANDSVDLHYVTFVKTEDGTLWELDGRRKGPLNRGQLEQNEDVLSEKALALGPLKFLSRESDDLRFSCVALAGSLD